jgi:metal-responsive CopG/Arc/MetJ family transcriptional regulator
MTKKQLVPVRLDPDVLEQLDRIVAESVGERSDHLRAAVAQYIARHQDLLPLPTDAGQPVAISSY